VLGKNPLGRVPLGQNAPVIVTDSYYLTTNGTDQSIDMEPYTFPTSGIARIVVDAEIVAGGGTLYIRTPIASEFTLSIPADNYGALGSQEGLEYMFGESGYAYARGDYGFEFDFDTGDIRVYIAGTLAGTFNYPDRLATLAGETTSTLSWGIVLSSYAQSDVYSMNVSENGVPVHTYDPSLSNGTGLVLTDSVGDAVATLNGYNPPNDDSQWVGYGGGEVDTTLPVIVVSGDLVTAIVVNGTFTSPTSSATDDTDGTVAVNIDGDTVDPDTVGSYTITYDAVDAAGNNAIQVTRTFIVEYIYQSILRSFSPNHRWRLNNDAYIDTGVSDTSSITNSIQGDGGSFELDPICEGNNYSWLADNEVAREAPDNNEMNLIATTARTMGGWVRLNTTNATLASIYKEGDDTNNICLLIGMGNVLVAQMTDASNDSAHAYSDFKMEVGRSYHIVFRFDYGEATPEFRLYIDGNLQTVTSGNPLLATDLDAHVGDIVFGGTDMSLTVGGSDVAFLNMASCNYAEWSSWNIAISATDIRDSLFRRGAIPTNIITTDTQENMQLALDALADTSIANSPISLRVEPVTGDGVLTLNADNITFDQKSTVFVEWMGTSTLTWVNSNGSNLTSDKWFSSQGGGLTISEPVSSPVLTLRGLKVSTEIRVYEAGTINELAGQDNVTSGFFSAIINNPNVDIAIISTEYEIMKLKNIDTSISTNLPIQQKIDINYRNI
jgi:hypothetical protein